MAAQMSDSGMSLAQLLGAETLPDFMAPLRVSGLQMDSRKIKPGDLFIAVPGVGGSSAASGDQVVRSDGRAYIGRAVAAGAVAVIAEQDGWQEFASQEYSVPTWRIDGLASKVSALAGRFHGEPSHHMKVVGITGTNGKTTCSQLLAQLFSYLGEVTGVIGTLGYGVLEAARQDASGRSASGSGAGLSPASLTATGLTTPDAVSSQEILAEMCSRGVQRVAMEVSSHSLDQGRVSGVHMDGAVFTNLSRDHLDYHQTMAEYLAAKQKLFQFPGLQYAVINLDDPAGRTLADGLAAPVECYSYSIVDRTASLHVTDVEWSAAGVVATIVTPWGSARLSSGLIGEFNLSNLLAVIGAGCASGFALAEVVAAAGLLSAVAGRMEVISKGGPLVVVDYAHTPDALAKALEALRGFGGNELAGKLWCVFGCGGDRDKGKRPEMAAVAVRIADEVVVTTDNPRGEAPAVIIDDVLAGVAGVHGRTVAANTSLHRIEDRAEAIRFAIVNAASNDTVLIAGKGHEDYQLIGGKRLPFSDSAQARLALRDRGEGNDGA